MKSARLAVLGLGISLAASTAYAQDYSCEDNQSNENLKHAIKERQKLLEENLKDAISSYLSDEYPSCAPITKLISGGAGVVGIWVNSKEAKTILLLVGLSAILSCDGLKAYETKQILNRKAQTQFKLAFQLDGMNSAGLQSLCRELDPKIFSKNYYLKLIQKRAN